MRTIDFLTTIGNVDIVLNPLKFPFAGRSVDTELDYTFQSSKSAIVEAINSRVAISDLNRTTYLRSDWSKNGLVYFLQQKHCGCSNVTLICYRESSEQHYFSIEGEVFAITCALEQTK